MDVICGYSTELNAVSAVEQATVSIEDPKTIIYYCSHRMFEEITALLSSKYPNCEIFGATTAVAYQHDMNWDANPEGIGLVVTAYGDDFACKGGAIADTDNLSYEDYNSISDRFKELGTTENTICFEIVNVSGKSEDVTEIIMDATGDADIPVVGGCAGNDEFSFDTFVSYNGKIYDNGCIYVFIHNKKGEIKIVKGDICLPTRRTLVATDVDIEKRIVYEFDGIPAAEALADELNVPVEKLKKNMWKHPIGRVEGDDLNVVEVIDITPERGVKVASTVYGGVGLKLLENGKYEERIPVLIENLSKQAPNTGFCMMVIGRTISKFLIEENWVHKMTRGFDATVGQYSGFSGWGEQLNRNHLNQSILAVAFQE